MANNPTLWFRIKFKHRILSVVFLHKQFDLIETRNELTAAILNTEKTTATCFLVTLALIYFAQLVHSKYFILKGKNKEKAVHARKQEGRKAKQSHNSDRELARI